MGLFRKKKLNHAELVSKSPDFIVRGTANVWMQDAITPQGTPQGTPLHLTSSVQSLLGEHPPETAVAAHDSDEVYIAPTKRPEPSTPFKLRLKKSFSALFLDKQPSKLESLGFSKEVHEYGILTKYSESKSVQDHYRQHYQHLML
jgi:hypothetical protein